MEKIIKIVLDCIVGIVGWVFDGLFEAIKYFATTPQKTEFNASFTHKAEVLGKGKGFCLTGRKSLSISDSTKNVLVIGSTGNYKSSGVLIPSLLRMRGSSSLFVTDFSGELLQKTSGAFLEEGYDVLSLNYGNPESSEGYNPMLRMKNVSDIQKMSKMVIVNALGTGGKDPFWNLSAESLISLMATYLLKHADNEYRTLNNVYLLISTLAFAPEKIDRSIVKTNDEALLTEYKAFLSYGDKTLSSIIATCRSALSIFATDPQVALTTSHDTLNFHEFRKRKKILYINTNTSSMRYYSLVTSLLLEQVFAHVMSSLPTKGDLPLFFLIDEASSLYFNNLQITVSNIRKYNAGILQVYQSAAQLVDLYGQSVAKAITENSFARVYMPGQPISVAQELEATLGRFEYKDDKGTRHVRPLMTADEIQHSSDSLILCGNKPAIKTKIVPYFKQGNLLEMTNLSPYQPTNKLPFITPPTIQFD